MSEKTRVTLKICGYDFVLTSEDSEEYIRKVGALVEDHIGRLIACSNTMSTTMASIFTALEFCDEAAKSREAADNLRNQLKSYLEESRRSENEVNELRKREADLKRQVQELRTRLERGAKK